MLFSVALVIFIDLKIILGVIAGGTTISTVFHLNKLRHREVGSFYKAMQLSLGLTAEEQ